MSVHPAAGSFLPSEVALPDGTTLVLRALVASDEPALRTWFANLSEHSRYHRFHGHVGDLTSAQWRYLTQIDGVHHVALLAFHGNEIAGVARLIRLDDRDDSAEMAFLVDDELQRRGVGAVLRDVLLAIARVRQYRTLYAYVLPDNLAMRRLFADVDEVRIADRGDVIEVSLSS